MKSSFLERYNVGDRERVWHELRQLGGRAREPDLRDDVEAVVRTALLRARQNVDTLVARLRDQGYQFGDPPTNGGARVPHAPPDEHTPKFITWLDERFGPLPLTVRLWIEVVGDVSFLGEHPEWPADIVSDPLVVEFEYKAWQWADRLEAVRAHFAEEHETWKDSSERFGALSAFTLDVAPDALHKADISGGPPYGVLVPDISVDATFRFEDDVHMPFIEYLRLAFRYGGFPGTRLHPCDAGVLRTVGELREGLLDL